MRILDNGMLNSWIPCSTCSKTWFNSKGSDFKYDQMLVIILDILKSCQPTNEFFEGFQYIRWSISKTGKDKPCCSTVQQEVSKMSVEHLVKVSM